MQPPISNNSLFMPRQPDNQFAAAGSKHSGGNAMDMSTMNQSIDSASIISTNTYGNNQARNHIDASEPNLSSPPRLIENATDQAKIPSLLLGKFSGGQYPGGIGANN